MATYRIPVLLWEDHEGTITAALADFSEPVAAVADSTRDAVMQLKTFLRKSLEEGNEVENDNLLEPRLVEARVQVRAEYRTGRVNHPCPELVTLPVTAVAGRRKDGVLVCTLPTFARRFDYHGEDSLYALITHQVQVALQGLTPMEVSRFLPPVRFWLSDFIVRAPAAGRKGWVRPLPVLSAYAQPLTAREAFPGLKMALEREKEIEDLTARLKKERANILLVGETGSGKTTILLNSARSVEARWNEEARLAAPEGSRLPAEKRFWVTSGARLVAGAPYLGQWEERCQRLVEELEDLKGYLCVTNLLDLLRLGGSGPEDSLAAFFLPYLQRAELRMIAEVTPMELAACRRLMPGVVELFQILPVESFTGGRAITLLDRICSVRALNAHVVVEKGVPALIHRLYRRFLPYATLPGPASAFIASAFEKLEESGGANLESDAILAQFVKETGLPEPLLRDELPMVREEVVAALEREVIGQPSACELAADVILTFKAGLNDPKRPVAVLLFVGPTGVGKTELARALARELFGHTKEKQRLLRLDMSEYSGPGAAARLLGPPRGAPSAFIQSMRRTPFTVVLLDEIEKADASVFDVFLSVFDEGRLSDRFGRVTTFASSVIVMTSNLGASARPPVGFTGELSSPTAVVSTYFRPEFYNRLDAVVNFHPLAEATARAIVEKELAALARREGLARSGLHLEWEAAVVDLLVETGFDPRYGARPLQRALESLVVAPLARLLAAAPKMRSRTLRLARWGNVIEVA